MPTTRIKLRVIPRAKKNQIAGRRGDAVLVRLQAPPVEGAANKALKKFLAKQLGVRAGGIRIVAGERSRDKVIEIEGMSDEEAKTALGVE